MSEECELQVKSEFPTRSPEILVPVMALMTTRSCSVGVLLRAGRSRLPAEACRSFVFPYFFCDGFCFIVEREEVDRSRSGRRLPVVLMSCKRVAAI
jgi:hypothetical protein